MPVNGQRVNAGWWTRRQEVGMNAVVQRLFTIVGLVFGGTDSLTQLLLATGLVVLIWLVPTAEGGNIQRHKRPARPQVRCA